MKHSVQILYRLYLGVVLALGAYVLVLSVYRTASQTVSVDAYILLLLAAATAAFSLTIPGTGVRLSVSDVFIFANTIVFGPAMGAITAAADGFVGSMAARHASRRYLYSTFNTAAMCCSALVSGELVQRFFPGFATYGGVKPSFVQTVLPLAVLGILYYLLNTGALATVIALDRRLNVYRVWIDHLVWTVPSYLLAAVMAGLFSLTTSAVNAATAGVLLSVPVVVYVLYRHYTGLLAERGNTPPGIE
jgi:hypothetical protein